LVVKVKLKVGSPMIEYSLEIGRAQEIMQKILLP